MFELAVLITAPSPCPVPPPHMRIGVNETAIDQRQRVRVETRRQSMAVGPIAVQQQRNAWPNWSRWNPVWRRSYTCATTKTGSAGRPGSRNWKKSGIHVPEDKRTDAEFFATQPGNSQVLRPRARPPRNREPLLHLIRNTTLMKDYEVVGAMTLDAVRTIQTPTLLVYGRDSHFISSYEYLHKALPNCKPVLSPGGSIPVRWSSRNC